MKEIKPTKIDIDEYFIVSDDDDDDRYEISESDREIHLLYRSWEYMSEHNWEFFTHNYEKFAEHTDDHIGGTHYMIDHGMMSEPTFVRYDPFEIKVKYNGDVYDKCLMYVSYNDCDWECVESVQNVHIILRKDIH